MQSIICLVLHSNDIVIVFRGPHRDRARINDAVVVSNSFLRICLDVEVPQSTGFEEQNSKTSFLVPRDPLGTLRILRSLGVDTLISQGKDCQSDDHTDGEIECFELHGVRERIGQQRQHSMSVLNNSACQQDGKRNDALSI